MKWSTLLFFIGFIILIAATNSCSPALTVTNDYDRTANFTQYKTFAIDTMRMSQSVSQLNQKRIVNAVKSEMGKKDFIESATPDLLVHISAVFEKQKSVSSTTDYYGYGGFYRPYMWGGGMGANGYTTYNVQNYTDGSLIVDVADAKSKNLLWEGIGNKEIDKPAKDPDGAISEAVKKILANFPPGMATK